MSALPSAIEPNLSADPSFSLARFRERAGMDRLGPHFAGFIEPQPLGTAAGGKVTDDTGGPLRFGERTDGFIVPAFIAWGDPSAATDARH